MNTNCLTYWVTVEIQKLPGSNIDISHKSIKPNISIQLWILCFCVQLILYY